jgi:hypothetical protein
MPYSTGGCVRACRRFASLRNTATTATYAGRVLDARTKEERMGEGYVVDDAGLAARVGELNACAEEVASVIGVLGAQGCDLGPGDISAAVGEVMRQWSDGLDTMRDKIDDTAENVRKALGNYQTLEDEGESRMRELANREVVDQQLDMLRGAAVVTLAQERGTR